MLPYRLWRTLPVYSLYRAGLAGRGGSRGFSTSGTKAGNRSIGIWGACFDQGQPHEGVGDAPALLRKRGLIASLEERGFSVTDYGDIARVRDQGKRERKTIFEFNREVATRVTQVLGEGKLCLTLGGDHSVGLGTVAGHLAHDPEVVVIWVDAHADLNTIASSGSGNVHGMPLSFNIKELQEENTGALNPGELEWLHSDLLPSRLVYIGLRDVDEGEWKSIQKFSIPCFSMKQVDRLGIATTVQTAIQTVDPQGKRKIHMSFDIDSLDPREAPATGTRVRGGLTLREALTLCEIVEETGRLAAMDMVEVNPALAKTADDLILTVDAAIEIILAAMGSPKQ